MEDTAKLTFHNKYNVLTKDFIDLDKRILYVFGELNEEIGTTLRVKYAAIKAYWNEIVKQPFTDITIDISSYGGSIYSIYSSLDFYDEVFREDQVLVNTKAQGICMSAATVLLAGGTGTRTATQRCKLMLHDMQIGDIGGGSATQVQAMVRSLGEEQRELFKFYVQFSRKNKNLPDLTKTQMNREINKWIKKYAENSIEHYLTSEMAMKLNLIDSILL